MTGVNTIIGAVFLIALGTFSIRTVLPVPTFQINSLSVDTRAQTVTQDRTISTDQPAVTLIWTATVEDSNGDSIRRCEGSGINGYPPGRKAVVFSLPDWTGKPECTFASLPPGLYRLRGSWRGGEISIGARSQPFQVGVTQ